MNVARRNVQINRSTLSVDVFFSSIAATTRKRERAGECFRVNNLLALVKYHFRIWFATTIQHAERSQYFTHEHIDCGGGALGPNAEVDTFWVAGKYASNDCLHILD